jgi:hypothetical protein
MADPNRELDLEREGELADNTEAAYPNSAEQDLLDWAQHSSDPEIQRLVEQARAGDERPAGRPYWQQALVGAWQEVTARPQDFYGTAAVTPELKRDAKLTANSVSIATWLNFISTQPLLWFAFGALGPLRPVASVGMNLLLLRLTNNSATATAKSKRGHRCWSLWSLLGLIGLNVVQSLLAGMGTELMLSRSKLQQRKAEQLVEQTLSEREAAVKQLETQDPQDPRFADVQSQCQQNRQEMEQLERGSPRWDALRARTRGTWAEERNQDWSQVKYANLPVCKRVQRLEQQQSERAAAQRQELRALKNQRQQARSEKQFLQQALPGKYERNFTQEGKLESGNELFGTAGLYFYQNLVKGNWAKLGFSLFFFFLSLFTSFLAMGMSAAMAKRSDAQRSRSDAVASERDRWFYELRRQMEQRHEREQGQAPEGSEPGTADGDGREPS